MAREQQSLPITDAEAAALFAGMERFGLIGLAVSGGPDSLALLHLMARWRAALSNPPRVLVLTVDHGLRPQAADEARFAGQQAAGLGLAHETLRWSGDKPATGLANAARDARYRLMTERLAREAVDLCALVTAHTEDDQAETVLMRLARGSGIEGLAGMVRERKLPGDTAVMLVRPLLSIGKARLEATLTALGTGWVTDPTNSDPAYERARLRHLQGLREQAGLANAALALSASRLARANAALEAATVRLEAGSVRHYPAIKAVVDRRDFETADDELRNRLLARLIRRYGGDHPSARLSEIERLAGLLASPAATAATLGGCRISLKASEITIGREAGRGLPVIELQPGQTALWDGRFHVALSAEAPGACTVRAISQQTWSTLKRGCAGLATPFDAEALTVPIFWHDNRLVCAPQLGHADQLEWRLHDTPAWLAPIGELHRFEALCTAVFWTAKAVR